MLYVFCRLYPTFASIMCTRTYALLPTLHCGQCDTRGVSKVLLGGVCGEIPPPPGASKGNGFVIGPRSGPHPLVFPNLPSCPTPILLHMFRSVVYRIPMWRHVLLHICYAMCYDVTHHATMSCHAC